MGRVVNDMPDEPLPYLIRLVQRRQDKASSASILRKSTSDLVNSTKRETTASKLGRSMNLSKSTSFQNKPKSPITKQPKPDWDSSKKVKSFDELWDSRGEKKENGISQDDEIYISRGYSGPVVKDDEDALQGELNIIKFRKTKESVSEQRKTETSYAPTTARGRLALQERRRKRIDNLKTRDEKDSGYEDERDFTVQDDALELYGKNGREILCKEK